MPPGWRGTLYLKGKQSPYGLTYYNGAVEDGATSHPGALPTCERGGCAGCAVGARSEPVWLAATALLWSAAPVRGLTHTVTSAADTTDGDCTAAHCTLREAIAAANADGGGTIAFAIGTGPVAIALASALPDFATPILLDGTTPTDPYAWLSERVIP